MARPRPTRVPQTAAVACRNVAFAALRRWLVRPWPPRTFAILDRGDHLRRDVSLPALAFRHGYADRPHWWSIVQRR